MLTLLIRFALRNTLRHRLRSLLTLAGIIVAILAFGLLQTVISAWYAGVDAAAANRLITRNAISLTFSMPLAYAERIRAQPGVEAVSWANWFGGVYIDESNFFPQFAVDANSYFDLYPEFIISPDELAAFQRERRGVIVGAKLAKRFGWQVGDTVPLRGTIYTGNWEFVISGIYQGRDASTDENQFFLHWDYLNEAVKARAPAWANQIGVFVIRFAPGESAAGVSQRVDLEFRNSLAETLTETEKAFQMSFVAMTGAIVKAIQIVSYVVILIIMAVMANTMAMAARERSSEYATLKALGFPPATVGWLVLAESLALALAGGGLGILLTPPLAGVIGSKLDNFFPVFQVATSTVEQQVLAALVIGLSAAILPAARAMHIRIVDGLRAIT
ncbi:ABC transporter permease [Chitinilyticum aquatile]|uniref:ABC transporter permease n=1 Tax=Chitinilyticum aquatile TaxID=362520 RepID=UPI000415227A|nr:ABC transporter permease [Chitinilyticum aquatile]